MKESEKGLADAKRMAQFGNWEWDLATDKVYWSDEIHRTFGRNPQEGASGYNEFFNYVHPHDQDCKLTNLTLSISDNGVGISENIDIENLNSLGLQLVTFLVELLDGKLENKKKQWHGIHYKINCSRKK